MNKVVKKVLVSIGLNLLLAFVLAIPVIISFNSSGDAVIQWLFLIAAVGVLSLCIQLIVGFVLLFDPQKKETGQSMLIAVGLFLLIGFAVCGGARF